MLEYVYTFAVNVHLYWHIYFCSSFTRLLFFFFKIILIALINYLISLGIY